MLVNQKKYGRGRANFYKVNSYGGNIGPVADPRMHLCTYDARYTNLFSHDQRIYYVYQKFLKQDDVFYVSEHRGAYNNQKEIADIISKDPE